MERLSGMDATFLYVETPASHMHVAMTGIYDTSTMPNGYSFKAFRDHIESRLHLVPPFRRRLVEVPFQFHHPVWIEDPDFNLDNHVRSIKAPAPGGPRELAKIAAQIASVPLDRSRPLWEAWVIEGLQDGQVGFVAKVHHSAIDGASGAEIMTALYDLEPDPPVLEPTPVPVEAIPSNSELLGHAAVSKLRRATNALPLIARTVQSASKLIGNISNKEKLHGAVPLTAPPTPFNQSIGPKRTVGFARVRLDEIKAVKDALGVTVNDVVLALVSGTLRHYLEAHDALPEDSLLAVCPVSVRDESERNAGGNKVSAMFVQLASDIDDVGERIEAIARSTAGAKEDHNALGARTLTDWAEWAAPRTFGLAMRTYSAMNLADRHRPIHNLVISNVPGPPFPLYLAGAEMIAAYPMGPIMDGAGLNVTVLSYREHVDIGFMACSDLIPDVWDLSAAVDPAFDEIKQVAASRNPTIVKRAAPVTEIPAAARNRPSPTRTTNQNGSTGTPPPASKAKATKRTTKKASAKNTAPTKPAARKSAAKKPSTKKATAKKAAAKKSGAVKKSAAPV